MLKAIITDATEIPEALKAEYQEMPDPANKEKTIWVLEVDDSVKFHPKTRPLAKALDATKVELNEKRTALAEALQKLALVPEGFDPDAYNALLEDSNNKGKKIDERIAAVRAEEAKKKEAELAPHIQRVQLLEGVLKNRARDDALTEALTEANIAPEFMAASRALIAQKYGVKVEEPEPGRFTVAVPTEAGDSDAKEFVKEWVATPEGKPFVNKAKGGGAGGGNGVIHGENPWAKDQWNLTKQSNLVKSNPQVARNLAQAAGVKPIW